MTRVLHLDDSDLDAELVRERLVSDGGPGWDFVHVPTREAFEAALAAGAYDLVLADYNIPGYDGLSAVQLAHRVQPDAPIIVISGTVSEEEAVAALRAGAVDYIFKQRLQRLAPAARRAVDEAKERRLRREAERRIVESEKRFRATFEQAAVGIAFLDFSGRRVQVNQRYCEIVGRSAGELLAGVAVNHPEDAQASAERRAALAGGETLANRGLTRYVRKDGSVVWCDVTNSLVRDADDQPIYILTVIQDVTERVRTQKELAELNASLERKVAERTRALATETAKLRAVLDTAADAIVTIDPEGLVTSFNRAAERMTGYAAAEMVGANVNRLMPALESWAHDGYLANYRQTGRARIIGTPGREVSVRRKVGTTFPARLSISEGLDDGRPFFTGILHDITELKERERQVLELNASLEQRAAQAEAANRELEAFSYSVSHDLRAPLHAVGGFAHALVEDCMAALDDRGRHYVERICAGAERMDTLIEDLLSLSRLSREEVMATDVDLSALAAAVMAEIRERDPARQARIEIRPGMRAYADARLLRVALTNLLGNAWKFSGCRDCVVIEVAQLEDAGGFQRFYVRDNGAGFDPAHVERLFGAFQRLHSQAEFPGTGIGLATVRRVIERHGGEVRAEGAVDAGATFHFSLPARHAG